MNIAIATRELHPRHIFRIARARRTAVRNVFLRIERGGVAGYGEASPNAYYGETAELVAVKLAGVEPLLHEERLTAGEDIERIWHSAWQFLQPSRAAQCALDLALWDLLAKERGCGVCELAWGEPDQPVKTFCTIGLSTMEELVVKLEELRDFPRIKIKSDRSADLAPIRFVVERCSAEVAVDANASWGEHDLTALTAQLSGLGIAFLEQPLDPRDDTLLRPAAFQLPVVADESCVTEADVDRVAAHFDGLNVKLVKCGGLTPALRMIRRGRALGKRVMVGCMLESSLLIAAGFVAAQQTDYADLDGAWLLADDPFSGLAFERGVLLPSSAAGLGVVPVADLME